MNLHANKEDFEKKTKDFFRSNNWHKSLVFLIFVVLAFIFWLTQYYQQTFEVETDIAIDYKNAPADIVLNKSLPEKVTVKISDKGTTILSYNFRKKSTRINLNLKDIDKIRSSYYIDPVTLNTAIRSTLSSSTSLISFYPSDITIEYLPLIGKDLPVVIDGVVSPAAGFIFSDSIAINPGRVIAYADSITLDTIHFIRTTPVSFPSINKPISEELKLVAPPHVSLSAYTVSIEADVEEYTEKSFMIPIQITNVPDNMNVNLFPPEVEVVCYLPLKNYSQLAAEDIAIVIDYNIFPNLASNTITFDLTKKPDYVINYRFVPDKISFLLEKIK